MIFSINISVSRKFSQSTITHYQQTNYQLQILSRSTHNREAGEEVILLKEFQNPLGDEDADESPSVSCFPFPDIQSAGSLKRI